MRIVTTMIVFGLVGILAGTKSIAEPGRIRARDLNPRIKTPNPILSSSAVSRKSRLSQERIGQSFWRSESHHQVFGISSDDAFCNLL